MGITIDGVILRLRFIEKSKRVTIPSESESIDMAVNIMKKYQKIEQVYNSWRTGDYKGSTEYMEEIGEVIRDGKTT